jgi:hypothetical protein
MQDMLVVVKLKEGTFEKFMGFMQSDAGMAERKKFVDVTKSVLLQIKELFWLNL